jgi:hypothetical protein
VGYSVASVRVGSKDASKGIVVGKSDVTDVVITLDVPQQLASIRGRISGLDPSRYASTRVEISGPVVIIGTLQTSIQPDGTFEFPTVIPGSYTLNLKSVPEFSPMNVILDSPTPFDVSVVVPRR